MIRSIKILLSGEGISIFDIIKGRKQPKVNITSVNLRFMGEMHSVGGKIVDSRVFELNIPFQNKIGSDLLPDTLKGPRLEISKVEVSQPFQLIECSPKFPVYVEYMNRVMFKLKI
ncbi:MAG: hypothetical protein QXF01_02100, partial [Candidatus Micrarchaeaceae archaeon]